MKQGCFRKRIFALALTLVMVLAIAPASIAIADDGLAPSGYVPITAASVTTPPAIIINSTSNDGSTINLTAETIHLDLPDGVNEAQFSVDGGRRWRNGRIPTTVAGRTGLFNAGMELHVRTVSGGGGDNILITFPRIAPRPRANHERLRPWFTADAWELRARPARANTVANPPAAATASYLIERGDALGRLPVNPVWRNPVAEDFAIPAQGTRVTVFFRSAPSRVEADGNVIYTPMGRQFRLRPRPQMRALNMTINYATEIIRMRADQEYSVNGGVTWTPAPADRNLDVSSYITGGTTILVRRASNGRRPANVAQSITPLPRGQLGAWYGTAGGAMFLTENHRISTQQGPASERTALMLRRFQVYEASTSRWRNVPTFNASGTHQIRLVHSATRGRDANNNRVMVGYAASLPMPLTITWSTTLDNPNRPGNTMAGILSAVITQPTP
jgi:hypothetical protein